MNNSYYQSTFGTETRDRLRMYHPDFKYEHMNNETSSPGPAVYDPLRSLTSIG